MSFASEAREELARESCASRCCARSELAAALLCSGGIAWRGHGSYSLALTTQDAATARHYYLLLKEHFGVACQLSTLRAEQLGGAVRYQVAAPDEATRALLEEMQLLDDGALFGILTLPREEITRYSCCKKAFVRGAFMLSGGAVNPEKSYHLEIDAPNDDFANKIIDILNYFEISAKKACRKTKFVVYLKRSEEISDVLRLMGASRSTLALEDVRIQKDMRNRINRQVNCDDSNIDRMMRTSERQREDIRYIAQELGLEKLPRTLQEISTLRLENPDSSMEELGQMCQPPIGKSGANLRLRRIVDIARKLRSGDEITL